MPACIICSLHGVGAGARPDPCGHGGGLVCPLILPTGCDVLCFDTVDFFLSHSLFFFFFLS